MVRRGILILETGIILVLLALLAGRLHTEGRFRIPLIDQTYEKGPFRSDLKNYHEPPPGATSWETDYLPPWVPTPPVITITEDTLNERRDYVVPKPENVYRIVVLGDSFTYGRFVSTAQNFPERMEDALNDPRLCRSAKKIEVINLGVYAYDLVYSAERFRARGTKYDPDLVIWYVVQNDFTDWPEYIRERSQDMLKEGRFPEEVYDPYKGVDGVFSPNGSASYARAWVAAREESMQKFGPAGIIRIETQALRDLRSLYDGPLIIATPERSTSQGLYTAHEEALRSFAEMSRDVHLFLGETPFTKDEVFLDGHPNERGHAKIADELAGKLIPSGMLPCAPAPLEEAAR